jgi:hypothetical protein
MQEKRYPKGHFLPIGMVMGLPLGIPIGIVLGMVAIGPAIGLILGIGIGLYLEKKYNPEPLPMTQEEESQRQKAIMLIGGIFLIGILMFIFLLLKS